MRAIPDDVLKKQIAASDPAISAWVSANAGAGKTHVLAQRVIRLMLDGVDPAKILCITFTKAAAANMANRVFDTLAAWTALDDAALDEAIRRIGSGKVDPARRIRARRLFATALETPGGLKVQTIHAFCTRLLQQFPFEANVAARFAVLDGAAEAQLLDSLVLAVLLDGASAPESAIGCALTRAIAFAADRTFKDTVKEAIGERHAVSAWLDAAGGVDEAIAELAPVLGIDPTDTVQSIEAEFFNRSLIAASEYPAVIAALREGLKTDGEHADRFAALASLTGSERLDTYLAIFCTAKLEPRKNVVTKSIQQNHPGLFRRLSDEQARVCALLERRRAARCRDRTAALITIAAEVLSRYRHEKERRGLLDYDDLIDKALALLESGAAAWVHYKLDLGIDHVLIDEAQDTSPQQWRIVEMLVSEFAAGAGARGVCRTLFAVGDDKQSIFSFQGAAPQMFADMQRQFRTKFENAALDWRDVRFDASFRSGASVLGAVDTVFAQPQVYAALTADPVQTVHRALPEAAPGLVEIWPALEPEKAEDVEPWYAPFDTPKENSPRVKLARKIAATIAVWDKQGRRPGDILILVRQRGPLFEAIIRALKSAGIAVAGADRLALTEHIAVMDLMVLADAMLLPQDDLALATVLRSPLFGLSEEQLFDIAWNRPLGRSLAAALRRKSGDPAFATVQERLDRLADLARRAAPFDFYAEVLGAMGGRRQFLARIGPEATDALDEFLNLALDYERRETPSLQGFLAWLRAAHAEVKRDMEIARDEVRVMTIHGAKGLEAPVVILADTTTRPTGPRDPSLLSLPLEQTPGTPDRIIWAGAQADDVEVIALARARARQAAEDEYRRLLYVAMTRAAERLIVCGADTRTKNKEGKPGRPEGCWYDLVRNALQTALIEEPADDGDGTVLRYRKGDGAAETVAAEHLEAERQMPAQPVDPLPEYLRRDAPAVRNIETILPSGALRKSLRESPPPLWRRSIRRSEAKADREGGQLRALPSWSTPQEPAPGRAQARPGWGREQAVLAGRVQTNQAAAFPMMRGRLVHRLLQALPAVAPGRREAVASRFLERNALEFTASERDAMAAQVLAVLRTSAFAALFVPGSRSEVPLVGSLIGPDGRPRPVSGQVDRLAVTPTEVLIADYKTDTPMPPVAPTEYVAQLALYRAVLGRLYPGHTIRAALLWTEGPELAEISAAELDAGLALTLAPLTSA